MANIPGFESLDKIKRTYPYFDLNTKKFSADKKSGYVGGVPVMYDSGTRRIYVDSSDTHSLVYGATGSLKTRDIVSPAIKVLGYAGESMIINDPKGELFSRHAGDLKKQGYNIVEINFRNPAVGNSWNPLYIPYLFYKNGDYDKAAEFINDVAVNLMTGDKTTDEPFWENAASDMMYGLTQLLFRYCRDHDLPINAVNLGNVINLRRKLFSGTASPQNTSLWKYASGDELIAASLSGSVFAPNDTRNSILSVFDQKMRSFTIHTTLLDMLANNDFDIEDISREKTVVFLITPDEKTSYHGLVSLFVKESYEYIIYVASQSDDIRVDNRINYILDEFSSLPKIADMPSMISAARSRDIKFLLVVQSKAALKQKYGEDADTIISNCTNWIFFTSRELELLKELSELCGMQKSHAPNISVYELQHFSKERREALVMAGRMKPAKVNMIDIDMFGDKKYTVLEHEKRERQERIKTDFELKEEIKNKLLPPGNPFNGSNPFKEKNVSNAPAVREFDIDRLAKDIDARIAELDKMEAEMKKAADSSKKQADAAKGE